MERREFIRAAILGSIATATGIKAGATGTEAASGSNTAAEALSGTEANSGAEAFKAAQNDLVAVMGGSPAEMYKKGIAEIGGMKRFIKKGDKVVVKPNIGWDKAPEFAADTNPELVGAIVKDCFAAGASEVVVFDHTCDTDWKSCYKRSGIEAAVEAAGGRMAFGNDEKYYKTVSLPKGVRLKSTKIHESIINCDKWINVPILKNHGGAKMSISMKNHMGIVWDREYFHSNNLQQCIADICTYEKRPVLNIIDGYRIMTQNGPKGKSVNDTMEAKALFLSPDIVAADTAAIKFFSQFKEMDIDRVGHIGFGEQHKLGTTKLENLKIKRVKL